MTPNYFPICDHIYFDGSSFRVRFVKNGIKTSKNFSSKRNAMKFKKESIQHSECNN